MIKTLFGGFGSTKAHSPGKRKSKTGERERERELVRIYPSVLTLGTDNYITVTNYSL